MAKFILIDEFHLPVSAPRGLPDDAYVAIRHTLDQRRFQRDLRRTVRDVVQRYPALNQVRIAITR